jgi:hypothetical protein
MDLITPFIDTNPFAETVTYTASGGQPVSIKVQFEDPYQLTSAQGIEYQNSNPNCLCKTSDVANANDEAMIVRNGITYYVKEVQPDGTGITRLILSKDLPQN